MAKDDDLQFLKEKFLKMRNDFPYYAEKNLRIRTKEGAIEFFELNTAQRFIHRRLERQLQSQGKVRALILKGRQQGCSTYVQGRFYWKITRNRGVRAFILTHAVDATRNLFNIGKRYHKHCLKVLKPEADRTNVRELNFVELDSGYSVSTAGSGGAGRSDTVQYFHGSEVAYWKNAAEHAKGALQTVAGVDGSEIILESTSAGANGWFYERCKDAQKPDSDWILVFIPWFWQLEYRKEFNEGLVLTEDEANYKNAFDLDINQIVWRRAKIRELGIGGFRREYPATVDEAFESETEGALWTRERIEAYRVDSPPCEMSRIVVSVDPAGSTSDDNDRTGLIVAGLGINDEGYILEDLTCRLEPSAWARRAIDAYYKWEADAVVVETNFGGNMVRETIRRADRRVKVIEVRASRAKHVRAEPVAAVAAVGELHHVGNFSELEDQMCQITTGGYQGNNSPDNLDALVWGVHELMLKDSNRTVMQKVNY